MKEQGQIQSVSRAIAILKCLARSPQGRSLKELAAELNLKVPTAHHLLSTLMAERFIQRLVNPTRYRLGPGVRELAHHNHDQDMRHRMEATLAQLADELPEHVIVISQAAGGEVATVLRVSPERPGVIQRPAQQIMAPYSSASALAFAAFWPADQRQQYRDHYPFEEYGTRTWTDAAALDQFLASVRATGHVLLGPNEASKLLRIAMPMFSEGEELVAVLGASISVEHMDDMTEATQQTIDALGSAAAEFAADHHSSSLI